MGVLFIGEKPMAGMPTFVRHMIYDVYNIRICDVFYIS